MDASLVPASATPSLHNFLFLGNPGTGKSTLINCLAGTSIFKSGLSYGGGLTKEFQKRIHDNVQYMDTPGLADRDIQENAAAAITEALSQSGMYKLFFMVRLENGRVVSDDLATIEVVLSSIDLKEIPFTVLINNVKKRQYAQMMEKGPDFVKVVTLINSTKHTTSHIAFIPVIDALDEEDNAVTKLPPDVEHLIRFHAPTVEISPNDVRSIRIEDFKKVSEELREEQEKLLNDTALMKRRIAELSTKPNFFSCTWRKVAALFDEHIMQPVVQRTHSRRPNADIRTAKPQENKHFDSADDGIVAHAANTGTMDAVNTTGAPNVIAEEKPQPSPPNEQNETMNLAHNISGKNIERYNDRAQELQTEAGERLVEIGVAPPSNLSKIPELQRVQHVGDPVLHTEAFRLRYLDDDGDEAMQP
ncbi:hypothetical protein F443_03043 [Phytophthora nicotianae P1569]|uniref:G domain-containing protein n=2 Tax=Phytophthora nicotianae TaxID=4792 RepID=V9FSM4_PHYNI|nr:hypothetical protein F443_03043 [Phytophthora nicotianae P1569]